MMTSQLTVEGPVGVQGGSKGRAGLCKGKEREGLLYVQVLQMLHYSAGERERSEKGRQGLALHTPTTAC